MRPHFLYDESKRYGEMNEKVNILMKNHLADTLKSLSREKKLGKISVGDIVKAGEVNRSTFYYHFRDKDDLIQYIQAFRAF